MESTFFFDNLEMRKTMYFSLNCILYIRKYRLCTFKLRFGRPIVASRQDRRPLGYASSLSPIPGPTGSLIKFPFSLASPLSPPWPKARPPLLCGCMHNALIKTRKLMFYPLRLLRNLKDKDRQFYSFDWNLYFNQYGIHWYPRILNIIIERNRK